MQESFLSQNFEELSDDELMLRTANGDGEAFRELVERHHGLVRSVAYRMGLPAVDVDDAAQQVFLRVWRAAQNYRPASTFTSWLLAIVRNVLRNYVRDWRNSPFGNLDVNDVYKENPTFIDQSCPDEELEKKEIGELVRSAIAELPENQRLALVLHRLEGLPQEVVADVLGVSVQAVKNLVHRAKENLRRKLAPLLEDN
ncbi:MAG: sigma-70 family RNA polymerase sigma factor [Chthoniobacterales bacterium]|nr:sigma-70 family RNA polymerase sigma factor [Chthoniobacterales bacterium]MCX7712375.1 sigma-70 family RNA polymerase sigma factor [Chthoniobacterales bacterium]